MRRQDILLWRLLHATMLHWHYPTLNSHGSGVRHWHCPCPCQLPPLLNTFSVEAGMSQRLLWRLTDYILLWRQGAHHTACYPRGLNSYSQCANRIPWLNMPKLVGKEVQRCLNSIWIGINNELKIHVYHYYYYIHNSHRYCTFPSNLHVPVWNVLHNKPNGFPIRRLMPLKTNLTRIKLDTRQPGYKWQMTQLSQMEHDSARQIPPCLLLRDSLELSVLTYETI